MGENYKRFVIQMMAIPGHICSALKFTYHLEGILRKMICSDGGNSFQSA